LDQTQDWICNYVFMPGPHTTSPLCNPGVVSDILTCIYASAAVNWFENKVNQFTAARTPYQTRAAQSRRRYGVF
jgi:hypothetical protein